METSGEEKNGYLVEPINISDLLSNGAHFEIDTEFNEFEDDIFDDIDVGSDDEDALDKNSPDLISPWLQSFESLRDKMIKIDENIYKRNVKVGFPESGLVPDRARVSIHYTSYEEHSTTSFDSTFMRGYPKQFYTGQGEILTGIEQAVRTMTKGEESQFVISHRVLFGVIGCPPRIKPKSDYLYVIKVNNFNEVGDANAIESVPEEDRNKFSVIFPKVKEVYKKGLDYFRLGNNHGAVKKFLNGQKALSFCHLANETEEKEQKEFLVKLYTNLTICYTQLNLPAKVCTMCNELRKISNINNNWKALLNEGKALRMLGNFKKSKTSLILAQKNQPNNQEIVKELEKLDETFKRFNKNEREFCQKAMGIVHSNEITKQNIGNKIDNKSNPFMNEMQEILESFKNDFKIKTMPLPDGLSTDEIKCIEELSKDLNLKLSINPIDQNLLIVKDSKNI